MAINAIDFNFCNAASAQQGDSDTLARAISRGDVAAMTRLGKRLVVGVRAPLLPGAGLELLTDAARRGDAEAPARLAVMAALGIGMKQDLRLALDWLAEAAERHWAPAREQLEVLAAPGAAAAAVASKRRGLWRCVAATVPLTNWLQARDGHELHPDPLLREHPGLLPPKVCRWLIADARLRQSRETVYDSLAGSARGDRLGRRFGKPFNVMEAGLPHVLAQQRIAASCGVPLDHLEPLHVLRCQAGDGPLLSAADPFGQVSHAHHAACDEPLTTRSEGRRMAVMLVDLNGEGGDIDDAARQMTGQRVAQRPAGRGGASLRWAGETGVTVWPQLKFAYRGGCGDAVVFLTARASGEPDERSVHTLRPPAWGERWLLSQVVHDRPAGWGVARVS